jgi:outer membrane receptor protein involved in Fe transport
MPVMKARRVLAVVASAAGLLIGTTVFAQSTTGSFQGSITDPSGSPLPGVTLTITSTATGLTRTTVTNQSGNYDASLLPPGNYNITAELPGFQKLQKSDIALPINQNKRVDFRLELASVQESVQVVAQVPLVDTQDSAMRQVVGEAQIVALPLNGRNFRDLGLIVPGVQDMAQNSNLASRGGGINIVGAQDTQNNFLLDGFDNNDPTTGETLTYPTVDSVQEFTIMGASYGAGIGFANGGIVSLVTKSGSQQLRGDAWEFVRNDAFNQKNYFATGEKPPLNRNQFGGTVGGALSQHLFFFGGYESTIDHEGVTQTATIPTLAMRNGDFSGMPTIKDPTTGLPFLNNQILNGRINQIARNILNMLYPPPTSDGASRNYVASPVVPNNLQVGSGRVDYTPSSTNSYFMRYSQYWQSSIDTSPSPFAVAQTQTIKHNYNIGGEWTHVFGPQTVQEFRVGFGHVDNEKWPQNQDNWDKAIGLTGGTTATTAPNNLSGGPPTISLSGYQGITPFTNPFIRLHKLWQVAYAVTHNKEDHAIRIGGEYRHFRMDIVDDSNPEGSFTFTGRYTGNSVADLLLGYPSATTNLIGPPVNDENSWQLATYIEDNWRVSSSLTLTYGLRYEYQTPDTSSNDLLGAFVPSLGRAVVVGSNGVPEGVRNQYYKNFAPRGGIVWDPTGTGNHTIRGNYGIYYESLIHNIFEPSGYTSAPISQQGQFNASATTPNISLSDPFPSALANGTLATSGVDPTYHGGRTQRWDVGVQQAVASRGVIDVSYVGSRTTGQASSYNLNQPPAGPGAVQPRRPFPSYTTITWTDGTGETHYNALQAKYEQRLTKGLSLLTSYTLSKTTDNTQDGVANQDPTNRAADLGLASYDRRHRLVISLSYGLPFQSVWLKDWQVATISSFVSGPPITALLSIDNANIGATNNQRPNMSGDPNQNAPHTPNQWFDTSVFTAPAAFTFGNEPRSSITGPGFESVNATLSRRVRFGTRSLELRAEVFNLLNHANFLLPVTNFNSVSFGQVQAAQDPREFQFGIKFHF